MRDAATARAAAIMLQASTALIHRAGTVEVMARSASANNETVSATAIRFPPELHEQLRKAAEERNHSINYMVVKAVEDFLSRLIPANELKLVRD